ncbi:MAG: MOSC domain-containing protein [Phycisphaerales bacterium]
MHLVSVNVGRVREFPLDGKQVRTGIFKAPVQGPVDVTRTGLVGDEQANPLAHGGPEMALYCYPASNYLHWRSLIPAADLPFGRLGENLTIDSLDEHTVHIGDVLRIGTPARGATVQVSMPRIPCAKLGLAAGSPDFVPRFLASLRLGWYLRVLEQGPIAADDSLTLLRADPARLSVYEIARIRFVDAPSVDACRRALSSVSLSPKWAKWFSDRIHELSAAPA